jgi:tetratricopeptide (TPR) repeat protein
MLLASRYVYSPGIWGGNPDKGIAMLEDIAAMDGLDREDEHNIAVGIGFAHTMADRWDEAVPYFRRALDVYPGNIYAAAMLRLSESGGS